MSINNQKAGQENTITFRDLFELFIGNWKWFLLSVILALSVAATYIIITPPVYVSNASILIREDTKGNSVNATNMEAFSDLGLLKSNTNIKNEIHILNSPLLMEVVVKRLGLDYSYKTKYKKIRDENLYNDSPVLVKMDSVLSSQAVRFAIELLPDNKFRLSGFIINGIEISFNGEGEFLRPVETPYGKITVVTTSAYSGNSTGKMIFFSKMPVQDVAKRYKANLSVAMSDKEASVINLSIKDVVPQRGEDILATLINVYNESWVTDKNQITMSTSRFINDRLKLIEVELGNVDDSIYTFKSENLLPDITAVSSLYLSEVSSNTSKIALLQNQLSVAKYINTHINDTSKKYQLLLSNTGLGDASIESQIDKYNTTLIQRNNLLSNSSEKNPLVIDLTQALNMIREAIVKSMNDYIATLNIQISSALEQEKSTNKKIASNPNQAKYLISVERQQKVKEALYLFLLQKREENELSQAFTAYNTKVINVPVAEPNPVSPKKAFILLAALLAGLFIPGAVLYLLENMNTSVRDRKDLNVLTIPFLGVLPLVGKKKKSINNLFGKKKSQKYHVEVVIADKNRNIINEAFRIVRTNIDFMRDKTAKGGMIIMSTSMFPGSGKTFISANMALSMAVKGAKVLAVDCDLRKASLSTIVNSPNKGLSDYLNGSIKDIESIIVKGGLHDNLNIIPVGTIPPNPSELLLTPGFEELLLKFKNEYDYIFLDCPPVEVVTDTKIVGALCDLTLFVIRYGLMDKRILPDIEQIYKSARFKCMGTIFNGQDYESGKYGYAKYGYHKYGDYYGGGV